MWLSYGEKRAMANDLRAQERADVTPGIDTPVLSPGYVHCEAGMHPDHGDAVVFPPGQLLPKWAAEALAEQRPVPGCSAGGHRGWKSGKSDWFNRRTPATSRRLTQGSSQF
jgi:hypothetical protein